MRTILAEDAFSDRDARALNHAVHRAEASRCRHHGSAHLRFVRHVRRDENCRRADFAREPAPRIAVEVGDDDAGAGSGEAPYGCSA
ncbi:hypothetical protein D3C83_85500 [compost metagenome]